MTVQAQSADGVIHEFPDGTDPAVIGKVMKSYAAQNTKTSAPGFKFSDDAIRNASGRPGTSLVYMKPDQYLSLAPDLPDNSKSDRKEMSLQNSLAKGNDVDEVPSLEVVTDKNGTARVTDQDGRHRALFAKRAGVDLIPVAVQQFGKQQPIKSVKGMRDGGDAVPFDFSPVPQASPSATSTKPNAPSIMGGIKNAFVDIPKEISKESTANLQALKDSVTRPIGGDVLGSKALGGVVDYMKRPFEVAGNALNYLASPVTGAATSMVGRPVEIATGGALPREVTGDVVSAMIPVGGEAEAVGAAEKSANALKTADETSHAAKVTRLKADGVEPTIGQTYGGQARRSEEAAKSGPLVGGAVRAQEQKATDSFNRALYNKVLEPIGIKVGDKAPVGRDGISGIGDRLSNEYEKLKPRLSVKPDDELINNLSQIRTDVSELPPAQEKQFEAILNNRVLHRLGKTGEMDGETFKTVESELGTITRGYKGSPDPAQRMLGDALEQVTGALRDNMERSSDPAVRKELKNLNKSYAMFTRVEDAAAARKGGGGVISPGDLIGSVKKMDKSVRKRSFARGDALLQDFAQDAYDVLGNKMPDSGTPERLNFNHHGLLMYALGKATNRASHAAMNVAKSMTAPGMKNFLLSEKLKTSPFVHRAALPLNALLQLSNQAQDQ